MAIESAKAALKRMLTDSEFAAKVDKVRDNEEALKALMQSEGYDFTEEEFVTLAKNGTLQDQLMAYGQDQNEELSDELLEMVSGGSISYGGTMGITSIIDIIFDIISWSQQQ
jgi:predicted ribosomally synthesized peptide with nif11-like leader